MRVFDATRCLLPLTFAAAALLCPAPAAAQDAPPADRPGAAITTLEEQLWRDALHAATEPDAAQPYEHWFSRSAQRRSSQLKAVRTYQTLYPGGVHCDEAILLELRLLFEIAVLRGEPLHALGQRAQELLRNPPNETTLHEAAYWQILCQHCAASEPDSLPRFDQGEPTDAALVDRYRDYLDRYPSSHHTPRLATLVFEDALGRDDREVMNAMARLMEQHFPSHAATSLVLGRWRLTQTLGQPLRLLWQTIDQRRVDTSDSLGRPTLVVVWAGFDPPARTCVVEIERFRKQNPELEVIGISLDETPQRTRALCRQLEIPWPQVNDGQGWGGEFVRQWGLRQVPQVLVLDRAGRLVSVGGATQWQEPARSALQSARPVRPPPPRVQPAERGPD